MTLAFREIARSSQARSNRTKYDYDRLVKMVELYCDSCEGKNWRDVAQKLSRLGKWEFEDYSEQ